MNMQFALNRIICPNLSLRDFFRFASELKFPAIELRNDLMPNASIIDNLSVNEVKELSWEYKVDIATINALQKFNLPEKISEKQNELTDLLKLTEEIDCKAVVLCPNNDPSDKRDEETRYADLVKALTAYGPLFEEKNVLGYIEPLGFSISSLRSLLTAMDAIKDSGFTDVFKIVHDTFHHGLGPDDLSLLQENYDIQFTGIVHISGVETDGPIERYTDEQRVLVTENDRLSTKEQCRMLMSSGFEGLFSFEPFSPEIHSMNLSDVKTALQRSVDLLCYHSIQ